MNTLFGRFGDHGKYWRHVYKGLLLLDYLLRNGNEQIIREARVRQIEIQTLAHFQHIDEDGRDQGVSGIKLLPLLSPSNSRSSRTFAPDC